MLPQYGPIMANTLKTNGKLRAENLGITLPEITFATATYLDAMGENEYPIFGMIDVMQMAVPMRGVNKHYGDMTKPRDHEIEVRWVQQYLEDNRIQRSKNKAYLIGFPMGAGQISLERGDATEQEISYNISRYQLFADNVEIFLIDRVNGILRWRGEDYTESWRKFLYE